jgi:hypothetical protein
MPHRTYQGLLIKAKLSLYVIKHHVMKTYRSGGTAPPFLTSAVDGGDLSASRPGRFTIEERASCSQWIGDWVDPRVGLDAVEKRT